MTSPAQPRTALPLRHVASTPRDWGTFIAIGDSFTEGMRDTENVVAGKYAGWADRLATMLAADRRAQAPDARFRYANTAVRGRLIADIAGQQTDRAVSMVQQARAEDPGSPVLVSIVGGGNDILRPRTDVDGMAELLEEAVVRLREAGADVLLVTPTDPAGAPIIGATRGRVGLYIAHMLGIASRHGCYLLSQWDLRFLGDWRMWHADRIHMTAEGHRRVALAAHAALGHEETDGGEFRIPLDPTTAPRQTWAEHRRWAKVHAYPWVKRRLRRTSSGQGRPGKLPELTDWPMA